jgi:HEAT repeat protein
VPPLVSALGDQATHVREAAAAALGRIGDPAAIEPLRAALNDTHANVRHAAAAALEALGPQPGRTNTAGLRGNSRPTVRGQTPKP